ncbi:MAG: DUF4358 domain-containing protein [Oscillospiraceae bacterium]|nr:DUF4358 domain-containing protein [Oscillospiraceae bacterium]
MNAMKTRKIRRVCALVLALGMLLALPACGGGNEEEADIDLTAVMEELTGAYDMPEMMTVSSTDSLTSFYGIDPADVDSFAIQLCSTGLDADEIVLIRAVDQEAAARIAEKLETRYQSKLNQMQNYLPEQYEVIAACAVETRGTYVSMIISPDGEAMTALYHNYF